ncbi:hypothetical protein OPT61_g9967 [Boeremia exigua]|uniref:Uncharacterized protein n=1 Tax=Boeremia exigua TaxID=749465 RepID=A0ACC2HRU3_9PLEO|nr:hypothetical protein OPT61_g9967 [Boeremia exigua]
MPRQAGGSLQERSARAVTNSGTPDEQTPSQPVIREEHAIHNQQMTVHNGDIYNFVPPQDPALQAATLSHTLATAQTASKALHALIGGMQNASVDMQLLLSELEDFHTVAGTLLAYLNDGEFVESVVWAALSNELGEVVDGSLAVFEDGKIGVEGVDGAGEGEGDAGAGSGSGGVHSRSGLGEEEVDGLRRELASCKMAMNVAISMSSLYQSRITCVEMRDYHTRLQQLLQTIDDEQAAHLPPAPSHQAADRSTVRLDKTYALRHYLNSAASVLSGTTLRSPQSIHASPSTASTVLGDSQTYATASTIIGVTDAAICNQLLITNLPSKTTIILQVTPHQTISSIHAQIRQKTSLPFAAFQLVHRTRVLRAETATLASYNIPPGATLTCVSFRPRNTPGVWKEARCFTVRFASGLALGVPPGSAKTVRDVKWHIKGVMGMSHETLQLVFAGEVVADDECLTSSTFGPSSGNVVLHAVVRLSRSVGMSVHGDAGVYPDVPVAMNEAVVRQAVEEILSACTARIAEVAREERRGFHPPQLIMAPVPFLKGTGGNTTEFRGVGGAVAVAVVVFPRAGAIAVIGKRGRGPVYYRFNRLGRFSPLLMILLVQLFQV